MKKQIFSILFLFLMAKAHAQQQDYKALLHTFSINAKSDFENITGTQTDTASIFYPCKLKPDLGEVKIGKFANTATLNWIIPLAQSKAVQVAAQEFMKNTFADGKLYKTASEGTEDEGYITTNVYALGTTKPLLIFQTIYYKNAEDGEKSNFTIIMYGK
jgi:hypothetical protein